MEYIEELKELEKQNTLNTYSSGEENLDMKLLDNIIVDQIEDVSKNVHKTDLNKMQKNIKFKDIEINNDQNEWVETIVIFMFKNKLISNKCGEQDYNLCEELIYHVRFLETN